MLGAKSARHGVEHPSRTLWSTHGHRPVRRRSPRRDLLPPGLLWWVLAHPFIEFWRRVGTTVTLATMILLALLGVTGLMLDRDRLLLTDHGTHFLLPVFAAILPAVHLIVLLEERELGRRFGAAYDEYAARVPRYLPGAR